MLTEPEEDVWQWLSSPLEGGQSTPVHICAGHGHLGLLQRLLSQVSDPRPLLELTDVMGNTPLHLAAMTGHLPVVQYLLDHGAAVDAVTPYGTTPLHRAAMNGHLAVVRCLLVSYGATVDATTSSGMTPLHLAHRRGHRDVAQLLEALPDQGSLSPALLAVVLARLGFQASSEPL